MKENESPGRIRRTNKLEGIQMQKNKEIISWLKNTWTKHRKNIKTNKKGTDIE